MFVCQTGKKNLNRSWLRFWGFVEFTLRLHVRMIRLLLVYPMTGCQLVHHDCPWYRISVGYYR